MSSATKEDEKQNTFSDWWSENKFTFTVIYFISSSVISIVWMIMYVFNSFAAYMGAFMISVIMSIIAMGRFHEIIRLAIAVYKNIKEAKRYKRLNQKLEAQVETLRNQIDEEKNTIDDLGEQEQKISDEVKDIQK
eukprot:902902_1